ncbi:MAG: cyclophilin-like fold protein [Lautropia sp.]|nr:cyclophilin-like fold protein [Lautropia sp.]
MLKSLVLITVCAVACACNAETPKSAAPRQEGSPMNSPISTVVKMTVGKQTFNIQLEDNPASQQLGGLLPLELFMQDHLNNEKFAALPQSLPNNDSKIGNIRTGDVLLWQGNTLVVFYDNHSSSYRYTRIGKIADADSLKSTLGSGSVRVKFEK